MSSQEIIEGKVCTKCNEWKPYSEFYYHKTYDIYVSSCKICRQKDAAAKRAANGSRVNGKSVCIGDKKTCTKCGVLKPIVEFKKGKGLNGRISQCRECSNKAKVDLDRRRGIESRRHKGEKALLLGTKPCNVCGLVKQLSEFHKVDRMTDKRHNTCAVCINTEQMRKKRLKGVKPAGYQGRENLRNGSKICSRCDLLKPFSEFCKSKGKIDGHASICKGCVKLKPWYRAKDFENNIKNHGITIEEYAWCIYETDFKCPITGILYWSGGRETFPAIDHDHHMEKHGLYVVRGIISNKANLILGKVGDNPNILHALATYLESHHKRNSLV